MERKFGYVPSPKDSRNYTLDMFVKASDPLPKTYKLPYIPPVYDQGSSGMCNAFSLASLKEIQEYMERGVAVRYSPAFTYAQDGWWFEGMMMQQSVETMCKTGVCEFTELPIIGTKKECEAAFAAVNTPEFMDRASKQRTKSYVSVRTVDEIKTAILTLSPVLAGYILKTSFMNTDSSGIVAVPKAEETVIGGHAMLIVGWTEAHWIVLNSWGAGWGNNGLCYIPFEYTPNEAWSLTDMTPAKWKMEMWLGKKEYVVDGVTKTMDSEPILSAENRTIVPIRLVAEELGVTVEWEQATKKITLTK